MLWSNLHNEEQGLYGYFHEKRCGQWNIPRGDGSLECPVLRAQVHAQPGRQRAAYYPEAVYGNPRSQVWLLAINPGGGGLDDPSREDCPNELDPQWREFGLEAYGNHHLSYYADGRKDDFSALGATLLAGLRSDLEEMSLPDAIEDFTSVAIGNVVHCKCPSWSNPDPHFGWPETRQKLWTTCGKQTFEMLRYWRPRFVFCIRADILKEWLPWCAKNLMGVRPDSIDGGVALTWPDGNHTDLLRCWNQGYWPTPETVALSVQAALRRLEP